MATSPQAGIDQVKLAMANTNALFSSEVVGKRNFSALNDVYTANARILPPGTNMISGRQAITEFWTNLIRSADSKSAVLESVDVLPAGDGVVEIGRAVLTMAPQGQAATLEAKYVVYWRQEDGKWK